MTPLRSSKSDLIVKHALSLKQEVMTELLSASDEKSVVEDDEKDLPHRLLNKIQNTLPEIFEKEETLDDFIRLPKSALIKIFKSDRSCAPENMFFNILSKIVNFNNPMSKVLPTSLHRFNKSSVDGTLNEENHITINELEEEKFEEEEEDLKETRSKQIQYLNNYDNNDNSSAKSDDDDGEEKEEEKSMKLETNSERTVSVYSDPKKSIKELIPHVRLALVSRRALITEIRDSRYFTDDSIIEALKFQEDPDLLPNHTSEKRFRRRGYKIDFDLVHEDIEVTQAYVEKRSSTFFKRVKKSHLNETRYVTATHSEELPLHGIHYFEIKMLPSQNQNVTSKIFVGLCNPSDNVNLEDTYKDKSGLLFYTYDLKFWSNGAPLQASYGNRFMRIRNSIDSGDVVRIAIDFRRAKSFQPFWKDQEENPAQNSEIRNIFGHYPSFPAFNRSLNTHSSLNEEHGIRFRSRDNLSLFLNDNNEPIFFSSPCKIYYSVNNTEFSEGIDINLMSLESAPIHFAISLLEVGQQVECSRSIYFDSLDCIPSEPFLLEKHDSRLKPSSRSASISHLTVNNPVGDLHSANELI